MSAVMAAAEAPYCIHRYPSALIERVSLADGRMVMVRPVLPQDAQAEQSFIKALSPRSRRLRFHGALNALPDEVLRAMTAIDYRQHVALVAEAIDAEGCERLVADARYVVNAGSGAEFAIAVADDWQHEGLGRAMLQGLGRHARRQGLRRLEGSVLVGNEAMLALMRGWGAVFRLDPENEDALIASLSLD